MHSNTIESSGSVLGVEVAVVVVEVVVGIEQYQE
jgi:hypothetical protein